MPTFVQSAMNPNGTWQADAMDQSEQANRQAAFQAAQMANETAYRNLQAHLEQQRMAQQGSQFSQDLTARTGMHEEDLANSRLLQSNGQDFSREQALRELAARNHEADLLHGPGSIEAQRFEMDKNWQTELFNMMHGLSGGQPAMPASSPSAIPANPISQIRADYAAGNVPPTAPDGAGPLTALRQKLASGAPLPTGGAVGVGVGDTTMPTAGGMDLNKLRMIQAFAAMRNGGNIPDFVAQDTQHAAADLALHEAQRQAAQAQLDRFEAAGHHDQAVAYAQQHGLAAPQPNLDAVAQLPEIAAPLLNLKSAIARSKGRNVVRGTAGTDDIVQQAGRSIHDIIAAMQAHGIDPTVARSYVQKVIAGEGVQPGDTGLVFRPADQYIDEAARE